MPAIHVGSVVRLRSSFEDAGRLCVVIGAIPDPVSPLYRLGVVTPRRIFRGVRIAPLRDRLVGPAALEVLQPTERDADTATDPTVTARRAEDGSDILYGLASQLANAGAHKDYVRQVRTAAHAVRMALSPSNDDLEDDGQAGDDRSGINDHASKIHESLRPIER